MTDLFEAEAATTTTLDLRRLQRNKRRATRRKWTLVLSAVAIVIFSLGASTAWNFVKTFESEKTVIADYEGTGQGTLQVIVSPGDTGGDIATKLYEQGVVASRQAFLQEWNSNPDSQSIVPGYYVMQKEMKAIYALQALLDPGNRELRSVTVPEGSSLKVFTQKIATVTGATEAEVLKAMKDTEALGLPAEAKGNLEGWLFPATYKFNPGVTPTEVLMQMISTTITKLDELGVPEKDRQEILTVASIVEREALLDEDRPKIASVIYNRLKKDMRLEMDSTVKYVAPESEGVYVTKEEMAIDSPYNTYKNAGLPPGPIASPGASSIEAALHPAETNYLFFVTVNPQTGKTKYAKDFPTHQKYVKELNKWTKEHGSK